MQVDSESEDCRDQLDPTLTTRLRYKLSHTLNTVTLLALLQTTVNRLSLSPEEFRDGISLRYSWVFDALPKCCDGCRAKFNVEHVLTCKRGGYCFSIIMKYEMS